MMDFSSWDSIVSLPDIIIQYKFDAVNKMLYVYFAEFCPSKGGGVFWRVH